MYAISWNCVCVRRCTYVFIYYFILLVEFAFRQVVAVSHKHRVESFVAAIALSVSVSYIAVLYADTSMYVNVICSNIVELGNISMHGQYCKLGHAIVIA